jgi:hypothetical protein
MKVQETMYVLAIVVSLIWAGAPSMATTRVFLLGGQSNMDGYGICTQLPSPYNVSQPAVKFWRNNGWVSLQGGFGSSSAYFGPEVTFGYQIHVMHPSDGIYLVKYAVGGTALADAAKEWTPNGSGVTYNAFKSTVTAALQNLRNASLSPTIAGMLWMQGESDTAPNYAPAYAANLKNFIGKVRSDFATPDMPFVVGRIMAYSSYPFGTPSDNALVRTAQATVPTQASSASWINTDDLEVNPQGASWAGHYDAQGQIGLGLQFASKFVVARQVPRQRQKEEFSHE